MSDKMQTPLDVDGNSLAEISTMYEFVVARAKKTSSKENGNIISGKRSHANVLVFRLKDQECGE